VLTENHRSTQVILDASARLISYNNPYRLEVIAGIDKRLRSERKAGPPVRHVHYDTVSAEADGVAAMIDERPAAGLPPARPRHPRAQQQRRRSLPARAQRARPAHRFTGNRGLYSREEVRLLVSFLRVLASPDDSVPVFHLAGSEHVPRARARPPAHEPPRRAEEPPAARGAARSATR
jgi:DNA helicase-2/ATP-dependent DNA helicase PcrA